MEIENGHEIQAFKVMSIEKYPGQTFNFRLNSAQSASLKVERHAIEMDRISPCGLHQVLLH
jgi:hypothetical protein